MSLHGDLGKREQKKAGSALRVPGGNPVDGLPPARHTGAVVKPVPRAPRLFIT